MYKDPRQRYWLKVKLSASKGSAEPPKASCRSILAVYKTSGLRLQDLQGTLMDQGHPHVTALAVAEASVK